MSEGVFFCSTFMSSDFPSQEVALDHNEQASENLDIVFLELKYDFLKKNPRKNNLRFSQACFLWPKSSFYEKKIWGTWKLYNSPLWIERALREEIRLAWNYFAIVSQCLTLDYSEGHIMVIEATIPEVGITRRQEGTTHKLVVDIILREATTRKGVTIPKVDTIRWVVNQILNCILSIQAINDCHLMFVRIITAKQLPGRIWNQHARRKPVRWIRWLWRFRR